MNEGISDTSRLPLICADCGAIETDEQREYSLDCKCGGSWVEQAPSDKPPAPSPESSPGSSLIVPPTPVHMTDAAYRRAREILVADASRRGRPQPHTARDNRLPEEISPWLGLEPELAREMAELFPAPNPDIVASRRLIKVSNWGQNVAVGLSIPREILFVTGLRRGDLVLVSGWHQGCIRIVRIPEGENG